MQFFCDVEKPDGHPFGGNCRGFLRGVSRKFKKLGLTCNVGQSVSFTCSRMTTAARPVCPHRLWRLL